MRCRSQVLLVLAAVLLSASSSFAQFIQQGPRLTGTGATGPSQQGTSVAISADGNTAIVGGAYDDDARGAVWIFTRSGRTWTQQGPKFVGPTNMPGTHVQFGFAVALSSDGNTAVVGALGDDNNSGSAFVYTRTGSTWAQQGPKLVPSPACACSYFGAAVALSADGNTAVLGAPVGTPSGVWVFTRTGSTWAQQGQELVGTGQAGSPTSFGISVALSADGNLLLVGATFDYPAGAVWTFARTGSIWTQVGEKLSGTIGGLVNSEFGFSVALSADGTTAAVGSPADGSVGKGNVRIFTRSGSTWTPQGPPLAGTGAGGGGSGGGQGSSVSLSGDGNLLIESDPYDRLTDFQTGTDYTRGASWIFRRAGGTWSQIGHKLRSSDACCSGYVSEGFDVALSSDGRTAITGGTADNLYVGSSWIYARDSDLMRASDADGDARSDITVYHDVSGSWLSLTSASGYAGATNHGWGGTGYAPVPGDYDGDGKTDLGVYQQSSTYWYVLLSGANFTTTLMISAGGPGWVAVPGDYDGDGRTDPVVYNPSTGQWWGLMSGSNYTTSLAFTYGGAGYEAVPGDYDGDGRSDIGVFNNATGLWSVVLSGSNYTSGLVATVVGAGNVPVPADYDGDGRTDIAVYNVTTGLWSALESSTDNTTTLSVSWGGAGYAPAKGDFDGDGKADLALYVESTGWWYVLLSGANYTTTLTKNWGGAGYAAVPQ